MDNIYKAMAKFQDEFKGVEKTRNNTFTKTKYANLDDVVNAIKSTLKSCGLLLYQPLGIVDGEQVIFTRIIHIESGEIDESVLRIKDMLEKSTSQGIGSAITYGRRYSLCAHLNIVETEDDDGNAGERNPIEQCDDRQLSQIYDFLEATNTKEEKVNEHCKKAFGVESIRDLSHPQAQNIINMLKRKHEDAKK